MDSKPETVKNDKNEFKEKVHSILRQNRRAVYIGRVPSDTKRKFQQLGDEKFEGDYGFCLKALVDFYFERAKFEDLCSRVSVIERKLERLDNLKDKNGE